MALSVSVVQRAVTAQVSVVNRPPLNLTVTPQAQPLKAFPVTVQQKTVTVQVATSPSAASSAFTYTQTTPATEWSISLPWKTGTFPLLLVDGRVEIPDILELSATLAVFRFASPSTGVVTFVRG